MPVPKATIEERKKFFRVRRAEREYGRKLRSVALQIGQIVSGMGAANPEALERVLRNYARMLGPWARAIATRMLADVMRRDEANWNRLSRVMSRELAKEIQTTPVGALLKQLQDEQVTLIKSLPLEAAERVHRLAQEARVSTAGRAASLASEILRTGLVTKSRATLIARTETSRVANNLMQARAQHVGSEGYIWRTSGDMDVRPLHAKLNGKFIRWDDPPVAGSQGEKAHAGCIYNCRCYAEPVIPDNV